MWGKSIYIEHLNQCLTAHTVLPWKLYTRTIGSQSSKDMVHKMTNTPFYKVLVEYTWTQHKVYGCSLVCCPGLQTHFSGSKKQLVNIWKYKQEIIYFPQKESTLIKSSIDQYNILLLLYKEKNHTAKQVPSIKATGVRFIRFVTSPIAHIVGTLVLEYSST